MGNADHDDHHDHAGHDGAHEIDKMPNSRLFNLLFGLSALTLLACIGVIQLFNRQVEQIGDARGEGASFQLQAYRDEQAQIGGAWGRVVMLDDDGVPSDRGGAGPREAERTHMPIAEARRRVLADPKLMAAQPKYPGWVDHDPAKQPVPGQPAAVPARPTRPMPRMVPGGIRGQAGAAPVPVPRPAPTDRPAPIPRPAPTEGKAPGEGKAPTEGKAPAKPKAPGEGKAPAKPKTPAPSKPPAPTKPAEGKAPPAEGKAPPAEGKADDAG